MAGVRWFQQTAVGSQCYETPDGKFRVFKADKVWRLLHQDSEGEMQWCQDFRTRGLAIGAAYAIRQEGE